MPRCWSTPSVLTALNAVTLAELELTQAELKAAFEAIPAAQREALQAAAARVRSYHEAQKKACGESWSYATPTARCWARRSRRWTASASMCPAARRPIHRRVLMNAIPAHVAGRGRDHHGGAHAQR